MEGRRAEAGGFARADPGWDRLLHHGPTRMPPCVPADRDGDGHIEAKELETVMRIMGMNRTAEEMTSLIESVDVDGNGKIELPEFANMMARQMLTRDGRVRRAAACSSPHPLAPWRGPFFRAPPWGAVVLCCAARGTLAPAAWREGPRKEAACTLLVAACGARGRTPGARQWRAQRWRAKVVGAAVGAVPSPRPAAQQRWWCCVGWAWEIDSVGRAGNTGSLALGIGTGPYARALG